MVRYSLSVGLLLVEWLVSGLFNKPISLLILVYTFPVFNEHFNELNIECIYIYIYIYILVTFKTL
jgi:hypothetical protein